MRNNHNDSHGGQETTLTEMLEASTEVEAAWVNEAHSRNVKKDACPTKGPFSYISLYITFLQDNFKEAPRGPAHHTQKL